MISLLSNATAADTNGAFAIIALISNPEAAQARLQELAEQAQENQKILVDATAAQKQAAADKAEAEALMKSANDLMADNQKAAGEISDKQAQLQLLADSLSKRSAELSAATKTSNQVIAEQEADLNAREDAVRTREQDAEKIMDTAQSLKAEYEQKVLALKAAVA